METETLSLSPTRAEQSTRLTPESTSPSTGMLSPGATRSTSPISMLSGTVSTASSPCRTTAFSGRMLRSISTPLSQRAST